MEAAAMDKLIENGEASPQLAQAIGEALGITLKAANLVTVPMLDARFRALEKAFEATKLWAALLYTGLAIAFFSALAVDHRWLVNREDQFMAQIQVRSDARFAQEEARTDKLIADERARTDRLIAQLQAHADQAEAGLDAKLDLLRMLLINGSRKANGTISSSP